MSHKGTSFQSRLGQGDMTRSGNSFSSPGTRNAVNIDLQKSIQLLDDAVSPSVIRSSRTPGGGLRRPANTATRREPSFFRTMDSPRTDAEPADRDPLFSRTLQGTTFEMTRPMFDEDVTQVDETEVTMTSLPYVATEDPGQKASSALFGQFMETMKAHQSPHQVMELLSGFESKCANQVNALEKLCKGVTKNIPKLNRTTSTLQMLRLEKETWQLLRSLYKDRLETEAKEDGLMDIQEEEDAKTWALSEQNIASRLYKKDATVRQSQLVIDWLEMCCADTIDTLRESAQFFMDQPMAWENTLHQLQKMKQGVKTKPDRPLVSEMDPDAPHRQRRHLDDLDREDERLLLQHLFWHLRAGQLDKAQELCSSCGQPWRAASLEGWRLLHDPNYTAGSAEAGPLVATEGNSGRDIWKAVCWRMCSQAGCDKYERAVYASLSGNLQAILPVCSSWMDYLWAYYRVMVDIRVEQEIRLHRLTERPLDELPEQYWDSLLEPHNIFKDIGASVNETVSRQSENRYHILQKHLILGDEQGLLEVMHSWLESDPPQHLLRLSAHIVLTLRAMGRALNECLCEAIIEAYVQSLIQQGGQNNLVAHYVATLKPEAQVQWYASFLRGVTDSDERKECLRLGEAEDLDMAAITKRVVELVRATENTQLPPEHSLAPDLTVTEEDKAKIDALSWLVFEPSHRAEAIQQANAIIREFIAVGKHLAARQAFEKLPPDTIEVIYQQWHIQSGSSELPARVSNAIREYMCIRAYLDAVESFNDWFSLFYHGQPAKPAGSEQLASLSFTDRVAMEHKLSQYQREHQRWRHKLLEQTQVTKDRIYNVLLFADGGWLVDTMEDPEEDESRQHQMSQLRKLHLPGLCLNLHNVLHSSQMYTQAIQIADVLASEQHQLYQEFRPEDMQHFLGQIQRSTRSLLDENKDPLGYELV